MKNIKIRLVCFIFVVMFSITIHSCVAENYDNSYVEYIIDENLDIFEEEYTTNRFSEEVLNNIHHFRSIVHVINEVFLSVDRPDFFGGTYFNNDGSLVVRIVECYITNPTNEYTIFREFLSANDVLVEYIERKLSLQELNAIKNTIWRLLVDEYEDRAKVFNNIAAMSVDEGRNSVRIELIVYNQEEIALFRETVLDSPAIIFVEAIGIPTTLYPPLGDIIEENEECSILSYPCPIVSFPLWTYILSDKTFLVVEILSASGQTWNYHTGFNVNVKLYYPSDESALGDIAHILVPDRFVDKIAYNDIWLTAYSPWDRGPIFPIKDGRLVFTDNYDDEGQTRSSIFALMDYSQDISRFDDRVLFHDGMSLDDLEIFFIDLPNQIRDHQAFVEELRICWAR